VGFYTGHVLPRLVVMTMSSPEFNAVRSRVASGLQGSVLEVGFGSGLNVPFYPRTVSRVQAVDPAIVGRKLAVKRVAKSPVPVEYVGLDAESLPLISDSIDHVLVTWTLCSIANVDRALAEILRVLRPGGALHFVEHGRAPDAKVARWQDRMTPLQRRFAGGCHLNRQIDRLVTASGLELRTLRNYYMTGPRVSGYMFEGTATKP
jgi:ubiquinone/menaquinone biosynthesis C-methylase UbiE